MDGDLFQAVLLGLLALGIIVLVALLATLGGIRKALEQRASASPQAEPAPASSAGYKASEADVTPAATQHEAASAQEAAVTPAAGGGQADSIRGVLQQHGLQGSQQAATPVAQEPAPQEQVDSVFAAHADDPQEEPFQRDGRWWFRRADELLLYDEATGQWQPAPDQGSAAPTTEGAAVGTTQAQPAVATAAATPAVADQVSTYWKCPTCGAVNGSTAATCRMCFAARP